MPTFPVPIEDTHTAVTRKVVSKVIEDIKRMTSLPLDTEVQYLGVNSRPIQPGSEITNSATKLQQPDNTSPSRALLRVTATEEHLNGDVIIASVLRNDEKFIFVDSKLPIAVKPTYALVELTLSIENRFNSEAAATKWRNGIRQRISMGRQTVPHRITYSYPIPGEVLYLIDALYTYRENNVGYGDTLTQWLGECFNDRVTTLVNQAGNHPLVVVSETQDNVIGWFDFESGTNAPVKEVSSGTFTIGVDYKIRYHRVDGVVMSYPLVIHNQVLPPDISDYYVNYQIQQNQTFMTNTMDAFAIQEKSRLFNPHGLKGGVTVPYFDDWTENKRAPSTVTLMRLLSLVDPNDLTAIFDVNNLGEYSIDPDVLEYMKADYTRLGLTYGAGIKISLYRHDTPMSDDILAITPELVVSSTRELSQREVYHVLISITSDLMAITDAAKTILCQHGIACRKIMLALAPDLEKVGLLPPLVGDDEVSRKAYIDAASYINQRFTRDYPTRKGGWVLVSNIVVSTQRR